MYSFVLKIFNDILEQLTVITVAGIVKYWNNQFAGEIKGMLNKNNSIKFTIYSFKNVFLGWYYRLQVKKRYFNT